MSLEDQSLIGRPVRATVVVADDHPLLRKAVCSLLQSHVQLKKCVEAVDGNDAVLKSLEMNPLLVILDITMPGLDGFGAARKIKEALPMVPVLMFTADTSPEVREFSRSVGAQGLVNKNEAGKTLLIAIDALLAGGTFFPNTDDHSSV